MTFSYHVRKKDDIKCYLLWNGQNHRFYPQDILDVFPEIFKMDEKERETFQNKKVDKIKEVIARMRPLRDEQFERFYCKLRQRSDFPKVYELKDSSSQLTIT